MHRSAFEMHRRDQVEQGGGGRFQTAAQSVLTMNSQHSLGLSPSSLGAAPCKSPSGLSTGLTGLLTSIKNRAGAGRRERHAAGLPLPGPAQAASHLRMNPSRMEQAQAQAQAVGAPKRLYFNTRRHRGSISTYTMGGDAAAEESEEEMEFRNIRVEDFNDVVDIDERRAASIVSQDLLGTLLESRYFRYVILFIIFVNAVLIGLETGEKFAKKYEHILIVFDKIVLAVFVSEMLLKWYYGFFIYWKLYWNCMDFCIVMILVLGPSLRFMQSSRYVHIFRVIRAFRSLRSITILSGMKAVAKAILTSIPDMVNILFLLVVIVAVLALIGTSMFNVKLPEYFGSLDDTMFSLFVAITQDGWVTILDRFIEKDEFIAVSGIVYMIIATLLGAFLFANLIVAVVVTNLENSIRSIREDERKLHTFAQEQAAPSALAAGQDGTQLDGTADGSAGGPVPFPQCARMTEMSGQAPLYLPSLCGVRPEKLANLQVLLVSLEENLEEYARVREALGRVRTLIHNLNASPDIRKDASGQARPQLSQAEFEKITEKLKEFRRTGDILSNFIELQQLVKETMDIDIEMGNMNELSRSLASYTNLERKRSRATVSYSNLPSAQ